MFDNFYVSLSANIKEQQINNYRIVKENNFFYLFENDQQWMCHDNQNEIVSRQLYSSYDLSEGNVLMSGLGFGFLLLSISKKESVKSVTIVEKSKEVIDMFLNTNNVPDNVVIVNEDINSFKSNKFYDVVLLDHYELETSDEKIKNANNILLNIKHNKFWFWTLEMIYMVKSYGIGPSKYFNNNLDFDVSSKWEPFIKKYFPTSNILHHTNENKIKEYIYVYAGKNAILDW